MNADVLTMTSYFGERQRVPGGFFADAQIEVFARHRIATSILLRGVSGFGFKHHYRSDQQLTLSEDLPLVSIAVDSRAKIERVADDLRVLGHRGLVTLERARLLRSPSGARQALPTTGRPSDAAKLTVYIGRGQQTYRVPAFTAVCELLHRRGLDTAGVMLGVDGTRDGQRARARFAGRNAAVPVMITAIGSAERIATVLPELGGLLHDPTITVERVQLCKRHGIILDYPLGTTRLDSIWAPRWQRLAVYTSASALYEGEPVHRVLARRLRASDARGVTVLGGFWGFHDDRPPRGDSIWRLGRDVPMCTVVVDTPHRLIRAFDAIDEITSEHGLVTTEVVPALVRSAGGPANPPTLTRHPTRRTPHRTLSIGNWTSAR